jgi:N-acyl-D-amino-acid deacylase
VSWDVLVRHGLIIDGSGRPGAIGDIALDGGRVAALGASLRGDAKKFVDAQGLAMAGCARDVKAPVRWPAPGT